MSVTNTSCSKLKLCYRLLVFTKWTELSDFSPVVDKSVWLAPGLYDCYIHYDIITSDVLINDVLINDLQILTIICQLTISCFITFDKYYFKIITPFD